MRCVSFEVAPIPMLDEVWCAASEWQSADQDLSDLWMDGDDSIDASLCLEPSSEIGQIDVMDCEQLAHSHACVQHDQGAVSPFALRHLPDGLNLIICEWISLWLALGCDMEQIGKVVVSQSKILSILIHLGKEQLYLGLFGCRSA